MSLSDDARTHLRVFVASPMDVAREREAVTGILDELNRMLGAAHGIHLDSWRWEMDAVPAQGEGQALINQELDRAAIVVVILWQRLGSPTKKAASGTVEEIDRALRNARKSGGRPRVMVYFCRRPAPPTTRTDAIDQLQGVVAFRQKYQKKAAQLEQPWHRRRALPTELGVGEDGVRRDALLARGPRAPVAKQVEQLAFGRR